MTDAELLDLLTLRASQRGHCTCTEGYPCLRCLGAAFQLRRWERFAADDYRPASAVELDDEQIAHYRALTCEIAIKAVGS